MVLYSVGLARDYQTTCSDSRYVVCNPATKSWVALPGSSNHSDEDELDEPPPVRLGLDPAVSRDFYVFVFVESAYDQTVAGVDIYSSKIGAWSYKRSHEWHYDYETILFDDSPIVFLNGILYFSTHYEVVGVDVEGESWLRLPAPEESPDDEDDLDNWDPGFLGQYQGHLCYMNLCDNRTNVAIWVLEDQEANEWVLKRQVTIEQLTEKICPPKTNYCHLITVHPDCNWILYLSGLEKDTLMAYDMDRNEVHVIQNLETCCVLLPYVPFYAKSLTDGH